MGVGLGGEQQHRKMDVAPRRHLSVCLGLALSVCPGSGDLLTRSQPPLGPAWPRRRVDMGWAGLWAREVGGHPVHA